MADQQEPSAPEYVEFHVTDDDLPPEALKDPMRPPKASTVVHCIHCDEEYDSWRMVYRVRVGYDGKVHGFWECPMDGCDGAGFEFDIFPIDPHYIAEDGRSQGEWVDCDEHDEECDCEECKQMQAELEADLAEWEKQKQAEAAAAKDAPAKADLPPKPVESTAEIDRRRINEAMSRLREPDGRIPLDDLLPESTCDDDHAADTDVCDESGAGARPGAGAGEGTGFELTRQTMMEIETKLGLHDSMESPTGHSSMPQVMRTKPQPLPPNWRELLARQDEERGSAHGALGEDDIPF